MKTRDGYLALKVGRSLISFKIDDVVNDEIVWRVPQLSGNWSPDRFVADLISYEEDHIYKGMYDSLASYYYIVNSDTYCIIRDRLEERRAWRREQEQKEKRQIPWW